MTHFGVDLSSNNVHPIDYGALAAHLRGLGGGAQPFAIVKITEGTTYTNPDEGPDLVGLRSAGFAVAGYLFDHGADDPAAEEQAFRAVAGPLSQADDDEAADGLAPAQYAAHLSELIRQSPTAIQYLNQGEVAEGLPQGAALWLADYNGTPCRASSPCLIHQYANGAAVPGCAGTFDLNAWCGAEAQFASFFSPPIPKEASLASAMKISPASGLPVFVGVTKAGDLWLWWETPQAQYVGPLGLDNGGDVVPGGLELDFDGNKLIRVKAEDTSGAVRVYWQNADATFSGPLSLPGS